MMKSFFKKLAFVMALAMVVSLAAPAATTASAAEESPLKIAYQNGSAISEINLTGAGETEDLRFLGVSNWKELGGATWSSNNEAVATVTDGGVVTAVAEGTAVVSVAIGTMTASVTVNVGNIKPYTVYIGEGEVREVTERTMKVGEEVDFNFYGVKDYSRDKIGATPRYACQWGTDDPTVLESKDNGVFVALKAGTAKATLMVINVVTNTIHNVIPVTVTVAADATPTPTPSLIVNELNATQNTVVLDFGTTTKLEASDVEMYRVFKADDDNNGDGIIDARDAVEPYEHFYVNSVAAVDKTDDAKWTVATFADFVDGATYEVRVKGRTEQFVASVGNVTKVVVYQTQEGVLASADTELVEAKVAVKLYDAKGVDVTTRKINGVPNNDSTNITFELASFDGSYSLDENRIAFYENVPAVVIATYCNNEVEAVSSGFTVIPTARAAYDVAEIVAWTLVQPGKKADWQKLVHTMPAGEEGWTIATLLKDTRGDYYTTHEASISSKYIDANGKEKYATWTENENASFWKNGLYVEYKAMNPDKMLIENYGEVASYEAGTARYALYLYNYNLDNNEFVRELYSQNITVCHERKMVGLDMSKSVTILLNTKDEDARTDAYYSAFSMAKVNAFLLDNHDNLKYAKQDQAVDAYFVTTLTTTQAKNESDDSYAALKELVEVTYAGMLNTAATDYDYDGTVDNWYRAITVQEKDFTDNGIDLTNRTQIKFTVKELATGKTASVTVNFKRIAHTVVKENGVTILDTKYALVKELLDKLKMNVYYPKYTLSTGNFAVSQYIADQRTDGTIDGHEVTLSMADKNGVTIGYDNRLFIAVDAKYDDITNIVDATGTAVSLGDLVTGDRVLVVKDPNGKIYPFVGKVAVANSKFNKKLAEQSTFAAPEESLLMGVQVKADTFSYPDIKGRDDVETLVPSYQLVFRATDATTNEVVYAKDGKYTIAIYTVRGVEEYANEMRKAVKDDFDQDASGNVTGFTAGTDYFTLADDCVNYDAAVTYEEDVTYYVVKKDDAGVEVPNEDQGKIHFATSTSLKSNIVATVKNDNPEVTYAGRDLTFTSEYTIDELVDVDKEYRIDNDADMLDLILAAFNFDLGGEAWAEPGVDETVKYYHLLPSDILYYTYTVAPSNNQIIINTVTFKVPVLKSDAAGKWYRTDDWYRSTATVNKSITLIEE